MSSSASSGTETSSPHPIETLADIALRYELPGPHATVIVPVPTPGTVGDDLDVRWSATMADLRHLGASERAIEQMDTVVASTRRRGHPLLLTANDDSAAYCWLGFEIDPAMHVGPLPALVPAIQQTAFTLSSTIAAVIDRVGADIYSVDTFDITPLTTVEGEDEQIHKAASGGWSQMRQQRHSEVIWERNAVLVATTISQEVQRSGASAVVLTGDDRATRLVEDHVVDRPDVNVVRCEAGGRHEPGTTERARAAALAERADRAVAEREAQLATLREELGQHDRAIDGAVEVLEAVTENRVGTLFVDIDEGRNDSHVDATVRAALAHGAQAVVGPGFGVRNGIAAVLRVPYR